jgi:hypothetical protein
MLNYIRHHYLKTKDGLETLNTFTFHVEEYITTKLENVFIKRQFNYESKHNAQTIYNKHFSLFKQNVRS